LVVVFTFVTLSAETHKFKLSEKMSLYEVTLSPGEYKLRLSEDIAEIYEGGRLLVKARIEVKPLEGFLPNSVNCKKGFLTKIRLKSERIVFLEKISL